ncbi:MAG: EpsG family protein [Flavobacterium sp.]
MALFFVVTACFTILPYSDGDIRLYEMVYDSILKTPNISFWDILSSFSVETGNFEIYIPLNVYLVSRFSDNIAYSYALTGLVYFFAWANIITQLFREYNSKKLENSRLLFYLLISFSIYILLFRVVNGRFYLAYWISIMSIYQILYNKKKQYYLFLVLSILIHQAFGFLVAIFALFQLSSFLFKYKYFDTFFIGLFILGTINSELSIDFARQNLEAIVGGNNYTDYLKDSYIQGLNEREKKWFLTLRTPLLFYTGYLLLLRLRYFKKILISDNNYLLFKFVLVFSAINAWTLNIPSFGERFRNVLIGFLLLLILKIYLDNKRVSFKYHLILLLVAFSFYKLVTLRVFSEYINLYAFFPLNLLFNSFDEEGFALFDLFS